MTSPVEVGNYIMGGGIATSVLIQALGWLYIRGKLDGKAQGHEGSQTAAIKQLRDDVNAARVAADSAERIADLAKQQIELHEDGCTAAYGQLRSDMRDGFNRIEARLNALTPRGGLRSDGT